MPQGGEGRSRGWVVLPCSGTGRLPAPTGLSRGCKAIPGAPLSAAGYGVASFQGDMFSNLHKSTVWPGSCLNILVERSEPTLQSLGPPNSPSRPGPHPSRARPAFQRLHTEQVCGQLQPSPCVCVFTQRHPLSCVVSPIQLDGRGGPHSCHSCHHQQKSLIFPDAEPELAKCLCVSLAVPGRGRGEKPSTLALLSSFHVKFAP